jgi:hypothetical protein
MKKIDPGQMITILANLGVIAGLIFVGVQLQQDRQIAVINGVEGAATGRQAWVENLSANRDLWVRGLSGEELSDADSAVFEALAQAHELYYFNNWNRARLIGAAVGDEIRWSREAALDFTTHPGLMAYWEEQQARLLITTQTPNSLWRDSVNDEISRMAK